MQRKLDFLISSDEEAIKKNGLFLDFDEIARRGSMSADEAFIAKWYGVYGMRQQGNLMVRVVIPGGVLDTSQVRALAKIAEDYGQGRVSFTTRQAAQLHWVKLGMLPDLLRDLQRAGMSTFHGCGDVTRNTAACPWATVCSHRRMDVLPYALDVHQAIVDDRDLDNLPRKFKITFSGCEADCGQPAINCVGVTAVTQTSGDGTEHQGFRVVIGGGMGWKPFIAKPLFGFVYPEHIVAVCRAVGKLFSEYGDRWNRATSRLKWVVYRKGIHFCREVVTEYLKEAGVELSDLEIMPVEDSGPAIPPRPLSQVDPVGTDDGAIERIMLPKGEIGFRELEQVAMLSEIYGDKRITGTNRQNIEIHGVDPRRRRELRADMAKLGFETDNFFGLADVVTCVGTTYCPLAVTKTWDVYDVLKDLVSSPKFGKISNKALINITGCPNSCSPYRISDIGLRGMRIREDIGSIEGYEVLIGGTQNRFGAKLGEYKTEDCVRVVEAVLDIFIALRQGEETLAGNMNRVGTQPYRAAVKALNIVYDMAVKPKEYAVVTGLAGTALDHKTNKRDVPCQAACPAGTRIPEYIEKIAAGDEQGAFRINQEDNVFPGVLGRVCTRPCEPACRHESTGANGPVAICHLKRAATDRKTAPPQPLDPWFETTTKQVVVVGGGPAGLTAARDLRRYGHEVTLIEGGQSLGGMMRYAIPRFRLPRDILDEEIAAIVDSGIDVRLETRMDGAGLEALLDQYDAVVVSAGANRPHRLELEGTSGEFVRSGLQFIKDFNSEKATDIKPPVLVVGGGFTAIDCARAARRLLGMGNGQVAVMYRRSVDEMTASRDEIEHLKQEQIDLEPLVSPVLGKEGETGDLESVSFVRNVPALRVSETKTAVRAIEGSEFDVPCKTLIYAIGQTRTLEILPKGVAITGRHQTDRRGLFVAGDFKTGSLDAIHAVAEGKNAAAEVDTYLMGKKRRRTQLNIGSVDVRQIGRLRDLDLVSPPPEVQLAVSRRGKFSEVAQGLDDKDVATHAGRCYLCHYKYEIDQDKCIHCDWCIKVSPRDCIRRLNRLFCDEDGAPITHVETELPKDTTFIWIDSDRCIRCGKCMQICPTDAIMLRRVNKMELNA
ncbi:MAG: FAD-dependent oxidoreductase [Proteobacteria bacterium]|nr:FAD-dependent oxidoreductase [Pseudomonadota bacterium]